MSRPAAERFRASPVQGPEGSHPGVTPADHARPELSVEAIYWAYGTRVYAVAMRMLGNVADAEDVTQEVLLQVVRKLETFRGEAVVTTWLHRVTVNAVLALRRRRATARERQLGDDAGDTVVGAAPATPRRRRERGPDDKALGAELRNQLEAAVARLPAAYRDPFVLSDVERLPNADICDLLGLTLSAVKSRLHRARLMLRDALRPYLEERCGAL